MEMVARPVRHQLGAEELLELGRTTRGVCHGNTPFLSNRPNRPNRPELGRGRLGGVQEVSQFIAGQLALALDVLGDLVGLAPGTLSQEGGAASDGLSDLLGNAPAVGVLYGQILILGNAAIKFGLSVPGLAPQGLTAVMSNISKAMSTKSTTAENQSSIGKAEENILSKAPDALKGEVKKALDAAGVTGGNPTPALNPGGIAPGEPGAAGNGLEKIIKIGVPVAGAAAVLFMLTQ